MCQVIRLNDGAEIETVAEFETYFGEFIEFDILDYIATGYTTVDDDYCLCCIDLNGFFAEHPSLSFEYTGDWWEK